MSEILDSGNRTEFDTGAVRDIQDDKGRCDLLPLKVVETLLADNKNILLHLENFKETNDQDYLYFVLHRFMKERYGSFEEGLLEVSVHFREGAEKYGENNWQKGLPEWSYLSSAVRHYLKWLRGDEDERHDRAFVWNILCLIWTIENIKSEETKVGARCGTESSSEAGSRSELPQNVLEG